MASRRERRSVLENTSFGVLAEAFGGVLSFAVVVIVARVLGREHFGLFVVVSAIAGIFQLVADFGITQIVVREIAKNPERVDRVVANARPLAMVFSLAAMIALVVLAPLVGTSSEVSVALTIMGAAVLTTFNAVTYGAVCRAFERMEFNAIGTLGHRIVLLTAVSIALYLDPSLVAVCWAFLIASTCLFVFQRSVVRSYFSNSKWRYDLRYWIFLCRAAVPMGLSIVFRKATSQLGPALLGWVATPAAAGVFGAAHRIILVLDRIPMVFSIPLYPAMSRLSDAHRDALRAVLDNAMRIFLAIVFPCAAFLFFMGNPVVRVIFGEAYEGSTTALRWLSIGILFYFPGVLLMYALTALGKQHLHAWISLAAFCVVVAASLALIPLAGAAGVAGALSMGEAIFWFGCVLQLARLGITVEWLRLSAVPAFGAALTGFVVSAVFPMPGLLELIGATCSFWAGYAAILWFAGGLKPAHLFALRSSAQVGLASDAEAMGG